MKIPWRNGQRKFRMEGITSWTPFAAALAVAVGTVLAQRCATKTRRFAQVVLHRRHASSATHGSSHERKPSRTKWCGCFRLDAMVYTGENETCRRSAEDLHIREKKRRMALQPAAFYTYDATTTRRYRCCCCQTFQDKRLDVVERHSLFCDPPRGKPKPSEVQSRGWWPSAA
jgi:hypothetical protein